MQLTNDEKNNLLNLEGDQAIAEINTAISKINMILTEHACIDDDMRECTNWLELQAGVSVANEELERFDQDDQWKASIASSYDKLTSAQVELNELIDDTELPDSSITKATLKEGVDRYFQKLNVIFRDQLGEVSYAASDDMEENFYAASFAR